MEASEDLVDFGGIAAEVGDGVGDGVLVLEAKEGGEFGLIEFGDAFGDVMGEDEFEEGLILRFLSEKIPVYFSFLVV